MKPQDIAFLFILLALLFLRKPKYFLTLGLVCLFISIPLFYFQVFFTAQRLVMYGAGFILIAIPLIIIEEKNK